VPSTCDPCTTSTHESNCYESTNDFVDDCAGNDCDVSGTLTSASVSAGVLEASGSVQAGEGLDKWSLVIAEDTVVSEDYASAPSSDTFDVEVDLGGFEIEDGSHTIALWVRDTTDCTGDVPVDSSKVDCEAEDYLRCDDGDVYWYSSCGTIGDREDNCSSSETCVEQGSTEAECSEDCGNGSVDAGEECDGTELDGETCSSLGYAGETGAGLSCEACSFNTSNCCTAEASYQCVTEGSGYDIYYYDSCGNQGSVRTYCDSDETCVNDSSTTASCNANCGNGSVDAGEDCDGSDLDGETCTSLGYDEGTLSCSSCSFDESGCSSCGESDYWSPDSTTDSDEGATVDGTTYGTGNGTTLDVELRDDGTGDVEFQICKASGSFSGSDLWVIFDEDELGEGVVYEAAVSTSSGSACTSWVAIDGSAWSEGDVFGGDMHIESPSSSEATWGSACVDDGSTTGDCWFMGSFGTMERTCL